MKAIWALADNPGVDTIMLTQSIGWNFYNRRIPL